MGTVPGTYMNYLTSSPQSSFEIFPFYILREVKEVVKGRAGMS